MYAAAFRLLHQKEDDCTSQSGKTERGGRHSFIIKFAFPSSIVHLIKKKRRKEKSAPRTLCHSPSKKSKKSLLLVSCCYFHMTTGITEVRGHFQFCVGAQHSGN